MTLPRIRVGRVRPSNQRAARRQVIDDAIRHMWHTHSARDIAAMIGDVTAGAVIHHAVQLGFETRAISAVPGVERNPRQPKPKPKCEPGLVHYAGREPQ